MFREQSLFFAGGGGGGGGGEIFGDQMVFQGDRGGSVVANRV